MPVPRRSSPLAYLIGLPVALWCLFGPPAQGGTTAGSQEALQLLIHRMRDQGLAREDRERAQASAQPLARLEVERVRSEHGPQSLEHARAIATYAEIACSCNCPLPPGVLELVEEALAIRELLFGPEAAEMIPGLLSLAKVVNRLEQFETNHQLLEEALALAEQHHGATSPELLPILHRLSAHHSTNHSSDEALAADQRIRDILVGDPDADPRDVLAARYEVARRAFFTGRYALAREELTPILATLGFDGVYTLPPDLGSLDKFTGEVLNLHGLFTVAEGDYPLARRRLEMALDLRRRLLRPNDSDIGASHLNLGNLEQTLGNLDAAQRHLEAAVRIWAADRGPDSGDMVLPHLALGQLLHERGDRPAARAAFEEALRILRMHGERTLHYYPQVIVPYGALLLDMGERDRALPLLEDAIKVLEQRGDEERPEYGTALLMLARLRAAEDDRASATVLARRALEARHAALGPDHPNMTAPLVLLAQLALEEDQATQAARLALEAAEILLRHIRRTAGALPEAQALRFAARSRVDLDVLLQASDHSPIQSAAGPSQAFNAVIQNRCLVLDEMALRQQRLHAATSPEIAALLAQVQIQRSRYAALVFQAHSPSSAPTHMADRISEAQVALEAAERRLADVSAAFRLQKEVALSGLADIRTHLPPRAALVSYVKSFWPEPTYSAFVLPSPRSAPVLITLGPAGRIDGLIEAWRHAVSARPSPIPSRAAQAEQTYREHGAALRRAVWDPLAKYLAGRELALVVPDSRLNMLNLATLPGAKGGYLLDSGPIIHYLSAERDLVRRRSAARMPPQPRLLAMGNPDYDALSTAAPPGVASAAATSAIAATVDAAPWVPRPCPVQSLPRFQPLPLSGDEIETIDALFRAGAAAGSASLQGPVLLTGADASESAFKRLAPGFSILHLATHAFFLPGDASTARRPSAGASPDCGLQAGPLVRSGLAFAGANRLAPDPPARPGPEDGILTSAEVAALDLSRAGWVVLSACESGMGDLQEGEGLLGLRRALRVAGAGSVIMSLWEVPDDAARDWMAALYRHRLAGDSTAGAVHQAAFSMLAARRAAGRPTHPYFWGAFIGVGDPD